MTLYMSTDFLLQLSRELRLASDLGRLGKQRAVLPVTLLDTACARAADAE
jgi:hypothetical protein